MYPKEYIEFLAHFHGDRDYFECHEILEEYWKERDPGNKESIWVGLILLAVSSYHHRRENRSGAKRTLVKAVKIFNEHVEEIIKLGLNHPHFMELLKKRLEMLEADEQYTNFQLPIEDPALLNQLKNQLKQTGWKWGVEQKETPSQIIHRHLLRDRTDVIEERNRALRAKKGSE